ncbi:MAG: 4-hydroxybenzoate octaprenyltransferase [Nitratireductor sp.]
MGEKVGIVADAVRGHWVHRFLPHWLWPYAQLARWERPIGWWLLMWPCWWSLAMALASQPGGTAATDWPKTVLSLALFLAGAFTMRGAGCTYNDLVDEDIDEKIARTRSRPLPSGRVTRRNAWLFLFLQLLLGLVILLQFNWTAIALGCLSLVTVVIYPFMKRITWWPQLFLGFAFSWGALMGWPEMTGEIAPPMFVLYFGSIFWVIGYDTIYALQDIEDDALVGVKSTARLFGSSARTAIAALYGAALVLFALAFMLAGVAWQAYVGLILGLAHMGWQLWRLDLDDPVLALRLFKSNSLFGWILFGGLMLAAITT